ncbi:MAG: helix-turn-helix transcriptional regulator [Burkholderiales bacterium]|nr:helix-turn-helix transcriptional regulator [Burkholderiales bacterium]
MIRFRLTELIADAQFKSGRRITLKEMSEATGINRMTLSRMSNVRGYGTSTETIDKLCKYFNCEVGDVAQYVDDESVQVSGEKLANGTASDPGSKFGSAGRRTPLKLGIPSEGEGKATRKGGLKPKGKV